MRILILKKIYLHVVLMSDNQFSSSEIGFLFTTFIILYARLIMQSYQRLLKGSHRCPHLICRSN